MLLTSVVASIVSYMPAIYAAREEVIEVNRVKTRSMAKKDEAEKRQVDAGLAVEQPVPKSISSYAVTSTTDVNSRPVHNLQPQQLPKKNVLVLRFLAALILPNVCVESVKDEKEEAVMFGSLVDSMASSVDKDEEYEVSKLEKRNGRGNDLPLVDIGGNRAELVEETVRDPTLEAVRSMATRKEKGYYLLDGLILKTSICSALETVPAIVLPHTRYEISISELLLVVKAALQCLSRQYLCLPLLHGFYSTHCYGL